MSNYSKLRVIFTGKLVDKEEIQTQKGSWLKLTLFTDEAYGYEGAFNGVAPESKEGFEKLDKDYYTKINKRYFQKNVPLTVYCDLRFKYGCPKEGKVFQATLIGFDKKYDELGVENQKFSGFQWHLLNFK